MSLKSSNDVSFNRSNPELAGVIGKIDRALMHVKEYETIVKSWTGRRPYTLEVDHYADGRIKRLYVKEHEAIPLALGLACGDAIHNLRSALDHLACCAAIRNGKTCNGVYFPIAPSKAEYPAIAADKLRKCPAKFHHFVESFQPYPGGNDFLHALHHLDIIDKHRTIAPMAISSPVVTIDAAYGIYGAFDFSMISAPIKIPTPSHRLQDGETIIDFSAACFPEGETDLNFELPIHVVFDDMAPIPGAPIAAALGQFSGHVLYITECAETLFFR